MADRSFEQKIKMELADLRMKPDEAAWTVIEATLHKEKKRRWFIWLFVLLGGCGTAGVLTYYSWNDEKINKGTAHNLATDRILKSGSVKLDVVSGKPLPDNEKKVPASGSSSYSKGVDDDHLKKPVVTVAQNNPHAIIDIKKIKKETDSEKVNTITDNKTNSIEVITNTIVFEQSTNLTEVTKPVKTSSVIIPENRKIDSTHSIAEAEPSEVLTSLQSQAVKESTANNLIAQKPISKKWQKNILLAAGYTSTRNGLSGNWTLANSNSGSLSGSQGGGGQSAFAAQDASPSGNPALSLNAGFEIQKQMSKRISLGISLGYTLYQTNVRVGNRVDSAMYFANARSYNDNNFYFTRGNAAMYREVQHFINADLNLYIPFQLFRKVAARWKLGAGLQAMIASNALLYEESSNSFFNNTSLLAKIQPNVSTGFDMAIGKQSLFYLGPHMQYTITPISNRSGNSRHLLFTSLKFSMSLAKKNKPVQR